MANAGKHMGGRANGQHGAKTAGVADPEAILDEFDIASDLKGRHSLQGGNGHGRVHERQAEAEGKGETDGLLESFEKLDKHVRAERDLGKKRHLTDTADGEEGGA